MKSPVAASTTAWTFRRAAKSDNWWNRSTAWRQIWKPAGSSIEASRRDLADINVQLEQRTRHIETILESVPSGVLSLDASRHIVHSNRAARRLLRLDEEPPASEQTLRDLFPEDAVSDLEHMLRKADRMGTTTSQMEIVTPRVNLNVAVTVASLDPPSTSQAMATSAHGIRRGI